MPAIQPDRLRSEVATLGQLFETPAKFASQLRELLDQYADRARRSGQSGAPAPLVPTYSTPAPVMRQISQELLARVRLRPEAGRAVAELLWDDDTLEIRQLGARLLALTAPYYPEVSLALLIEWADPELEKDLLYVFFEETAAILHLFNPDGYLNFTAKLLGRSDIPHRYMGLLALRPLVADMDFDNLPVAFNQIGPIVSEVTPSLRPALLELLQTLAGRAPEETAYFLRQVLLSQDNREPAWFLRQLKAKFPPEVQRRLRDYLA